MKTYNVTITETLEKIVEIKAKNQIEAEQMAEERWQQGEYILGAEEFTGANFEAEETNDDPQEKLIKLACKLRVQNEDFADYSVHDALFDASVALQIDLPDDDEEDDELVEEVRYRLGIDW